MRACVRVIRNYYFARSTDALCNYAIRCWGRRRIQKYLDLSLFHLLLLTPMTSFLLDLIRHGKAHQSPRQPDGNADSVSPTTTSTHRKEQKEPKSPAKQQEIPKSPPVPYQREAEIIVQEERQAKNKMPVYKGLERFKLLDKMGEYVA